MSKLKIAVSDSCPDCFTTQRECIYINESRNIDVAAIVLSLNDVTCGKLDEIDATGYGIPVFIATENQERVPAEGNDSNLLIVFYVQIMPDDFVMQLHRF